MGGKRRRFGNYERQEFIRSGGQAEVWKATHVRTGRIAALKILPRGVDKTAERRFRRELKVVARLKHPQIVEVLEAAPEADRGLWFVMEYAAGGTLRDRIVENSWGIGERLQAFRDICEGVKFAHREGIIHRDLKPENVLVFPSETGARFKVTDFGITRQTGLDTTTLTTTRQVVGTMHYWSPEHYRNFNLVDTRSDIFTLGKIYFEIISGERPEVQGRSVDEIRAELLPPYGDLIPKLLANNPAKRYQTIDELLDDFGRLLRLDASVQEFVPDPEGVAREIFRESWPPDAAAASRLAKALLACSGESRRVCTVLAYAPTGVFLALSECGQAHAAELLSRFLQGIPALRVPFPFNWLDGFVEEIAVCLRSMDLKQSSRQAAYAALVWMAYVFVRGEVQRLLAQKILNEVTLESDGALFEEALRDAGRDAIQRARDHLSNHALRPIKRHFYAAWQRAWVRINLPAEGPAKQLLLRVMTPNSLRLVLDRPQLLRVADVIAALRLIIEEHGELGVGAVQVITSRFAGSDRGQSMIDELARVGLPLELLLPRQQAEQVYDRLVVVAGAEGISFPIECLLELPEVLVGLR